MRNFEVNELVKECMNNNDIVGLKGALIAIIFSDKQFKTDDFDNTLEVLKLNGINIYEKYDGKELISKTKQSFTNQDYRNSIFDLEKNFCIERINEVKNISKSIYGNVVKNSVSNNIRKEVTPAKKKKSSQKKSPTEKILIGAAAVALTAAAIGITIKLLK